MGHGVWVRVPNAQCPKSAGGYPSTDTWVWSFPPTSNKIDILPDLKVQGFWIQTATAGIARLTSPSPTDNALPVAAILPKSRRSLDGALDPNFR
ncbi:MAG: hypothetical protein V7L23_22200 [Nostoc sp.]|uniref:hypothetical protein n=1 Tax=Nostoc sp. TaxID=1180 RepID=UPI002FEF6107